MNQYSTSIPPENIKKPSVFKGYRSRKAVENGLKLGKRNLHVYKILNSFSVVFFFFHSVVQLTCSIKKMFLKILQNSQKNTCARISLYSLRPAILSKKRLGYRCFLANSINFFILPFMEHLRWLLLFISSTIRIILAQD